MFHWWKPLWIQADSLLQSLSITRELWSSKPNLQKLRFSLPSVIKLRQQPTRTNGLWKKSTNHNPRMWTFKWITKWLTAAKKRNRWLSRVPESSHVIEKRWNTYNLQKEVLVCLGNWFILSPTLCNTIMNSTLQLHSRMTTTSRANKCGPKTLKRSKQCHLDLNRLNL